MDCQNSISNEEYQALIRMFLKGSHPPKEPPVFGRYDVAYHDYWNAYDYGSEIKYIYFKSGVLFHNPDKRKLVKNPAPTEKEKEERFKSSLSRTKSAIFELAMCNEFSYFCTFTQDEKLRDRFNLTDFRKDFTMLIRNLNRSRSETDKILYLLIPEQHKNGAWHLHGLFKGLGENDLTPFKLSDRIPKRIKDTIKSGTAVFDWKAYRKRFGYFTCTEIADKTACAKYITKYITKDLQSNKIECGGHLYFASQGLKRRETITKNSFEVCPISEWDFENDYVKIKTVKK